MVGREDKKMSKIRSTLYKTARILGDIESLSSPQKFVKRRVRKTLYKGWGRFIRKLIK
jgi:hypothetical protein